MIIKNLKCLLEFDPVYSRNQIIPAPFTSAAPEQIPLAPSPLWEVWGGGEIHHKYRDHSQRDPVRRLRIVTTAAEKLVWHFFRGGKLGAKFRR